MAFSRRVFYGDQEVKSVGDMTIVVTAGLCGIGVICPFDQTDHQIMHSGQNSSGSATCHTGRIFAESNIPAIVKSSFNPPMPAPE